MFHIFLVDDNLADSALLRLAFKRALPEAYVYTVSDSRLLPAYLNTKSPVESLRGRIHPQILVLSTAMPYYSGLETLAWVRTQPRFDSMFIVMLSSHDDLQQREQAKAAGANAYRVRLPGSNDLPDLAEGIIGQYTLLNASLAEAVAGAA